jgi:hypothetical protein
MSAVKGRAMPPRAMPMGGANYRETDAPEPGANMVRGPSHIIMAPYPDPWPLLPARMS